MWMRSSRGVVVSHVTVRQWGLKFGQSFANQIRRRLPSAGDKWHLDKVVLTIAGVKHWLWRAVDQNGTVLDILVRSRRDKGAALHEDIAASAWFKKCHFQVTPEIDRALIVRGFLVLGVTLI